MLSLKEAWPLILGTVFGTVARWLSLRSDYRHYPSYPAGYLTHLAIGFIAALIGAVLLPSLEARNYTAVTFLILAATQFFNVRSIERQTLEAEEKLALVERGPGYIEGIAKTYEERNYLVMLVGLLASAATVLLGPPAGALTGILATMGAVYLRQGKVLGDLCRVRPGKISFREGTLLFVEDVMLMEVGLPHARERYLREGLGMIIEPKGPRGQAVLWDLAQRQAIAHDAAAMVGVQTDVGYPEAVPICRMEMPQGTGRAALVILPVERDPEALAKAISRVPVLESAKGNPIVSPYLRRSEGGGNG